MSKVDITSSVAEKGLDIVKGFVEKISGGAIEETGLLFADRIRLRRFKNQIKILKEAQKIAKDSNIDIKQISLKTLVPLLEYCSLEEDEKLQEKWSNLLVNFIDKNQKFESTIFPFILNQLTSQEIVELEILYNFRRLDEELKPTISGAEFSNLIRLGLIEKELPPASIKRKTIFKRKETVEFKKVVHYRMTDLGREFVACCTPKSER